MTIDLAVICLRGYLEKKTTPRIQGVDLFCGAGGLTKGLISAGIEMRAGVDFEPSCKYPYEHNNKGVAFLNKSVSEITGREIKGFFDTGAVRLLCGCAPCQAFSSINQNNADRKTRSGKWVLLDEFARLVKESKPDLVTMENVPGLLGQDVFERFVKSLKDEGFHVSYQVVDCAQYGFPQRRRRLVLLASRFGDISFPRPGRRGRKQTVRSVIGGLGHLSAGEADPLDSLHVASKLSEMNMQRIRASNPGGTWHDWDESLRVPCHKEKSGDGYGAVYGRMEWDEPSPTITTQFYNYGSGRFGHPEQNRALSLREGALLQGFPRRYAFVEPGSHVQKRKVGTLIGNAVPVYLAKLVGRVLVKHAEKYAR